MAFRIPLRNRFIRRNIGPILGGIGLVVGVPVTLGGYFKYQEEQRFAREAIPIEGTVLSRNIRRAKSDTRTSTQYSITYRFTAADGQTYEDTDKVDVHFWERLVEQGPVGIEYLPSRPDRNRIAGNNHWGDTVLMGLLGSGFTVAGGIILGLSVRSRLERQWLLRHGLLSEGQITKVYETTFRINRVSQWRLNYRFTDYLGRDQEGRSGYLPSEEALRWKEGDSGEVRYDKNRPTRNIWIGSA
jgi:hypothetical protein